MWVENKHEHLPISTVIRDVTTFYQLFQNVTKQNHFMIVREDEPDIDYFQFKELSLLGAKVKFSDMLILTYGLYDPNFGE